MQKGEPLTRSRQRWKICKTLEITQDLDGTNAKCRRLGRRNWRGRVSREGNEYRDLMQPRAWRTVVHCWRLQSVFLTRGALYDRDMVSKE
jgi:hypothetical protein